MSEAGAAAPAAPSGGETGAAPQVDRADPPSWMQGMGNRGPRAEAKEAKETETLDANEETAEAGPERDDEKGNESPPDTSAKHKVKVSGEEIEVSLDELKSGYGRMKAATQKFQEASELIKEVDKREGVIKRFVDGMRRGDPGELASLLRKVGVDPDRFAEAHLRNVLKLADMPPHERGMMELQREREAFERERQTAQQQREEQAINAETETTLNTYVSEAKAAFQAAGVTASPTLMARAGAQMEHALTHGYQMTMKEAVGAVIEEARELARTMGKEAFSQHVGDPAQADKMKREAAKAASQQQRRTAATAAQVPRASSGQFVKKPMIVANGSFADAFAARAARDGRA